MPVKIRRMETTKEKDLAKSTTAQCIHGIDSAGNPIRINADDLMSLMPIATTASKSLMPKSFYEQFICWESPSNSTRAIKIASYSNIKSFGRDSRELTIQGFSFYAKVVLLASVSSAGTATNFSIIEIAKSTSNNTTLSLLLVATDDGYDIYVTGCFSSAYTRSNCFALCGGSYFKGNVGSELNVSSLTIDKEFSI